MRTRRAYPAVNGGGPLRNLVLLVAGFVYALAFLLPCHQAYAAGTGRFDATPLSSLRACMPGHEAGIPGGREGDANCCSFEPGAAIEDTRPVAHGGGPQGLAPRGMRSLLLQGISTAGTTRIASRAPAPGIALYLRNLRLLI